MRTPLNAILGFCSLAERERGAGGGRVWEYLDKINMPAASFFPSSTIFWNFLAPRQERSIWSRSRLTSANWRVLPPVSSGIRRRRRQRFTVQIRLEQSRVLGDEKKLTQVLNNLLSNAVKYTERGDEIRFEVEELRYSQHSKYRFQVEDTGIGMSKEFWINCSSRIPAKSPFHPRHDGHRPGHDDCENAGAPVERRGFGGKRAWKGELLHCDRAVRCGQPEKSGRSPDSRRKKPMTGTAAVSFLRRTTR